MIWTLLLTALLVGMLWQTLRTAGRAPHLRRMAWRNLVLHQNTTLLTILGAMIGTALITSALLFQHSVEQSGDELLQAQFGRIGYDATAPESNFVNESKVAQLRQRIEQGQVRDVSGLLPTAGRVTDLNTTDAAGQTLLLQPGVYLYGFDHDQARAFDEKAMQGVPEIGPGEIVLSAPVAQRLEVTAGDTVIGSGTSFTVAAVVQEQGLTGYRGIGQAHGTALVSLETARQLAGVPDGMYTNILLSYPTYLFGSGQVGSTAPVLFGTDIGLRGRAVRGEAEDALDHTMKLLPIFTIASWNAIAIGMMLIINIFKMIAEERRQEIGVLRALGMTRTDLSGLLRLEGAFYALLSGAAGVLIGIGLAYGMLLWIGDLFASAVTQLEGLQVVYRFQVGVEPLVTGFAIGVLLILLCSWRVTKQAADITIVEALYAAGEKVSGRIGKGRLSLPRTTLRLLAAWLALGLFLLTLTDSFRTWLREEFSGAFPLLLFGVGFFLTIVSSLLVTSSFAPLSAAVQKVFAPFGRLVAVLRMALRYPMLAQTRTRLLVLMFALVFFLTSMSGVFSATFSAQFAAYDARKVTGGYDLLALVEGKRVTTAELNKMLDTSPHVQPGSVSTAVSVWQAALYGQNDPMYERGKYPSINGIDAAFAEQTTLQLKERDPAYASDREAWRAVASDPSVMIVSERERNQQELLPNKRIIGVALYDTKSYTFLASSGVFLKQSEVKQATASELLIRLEDEQAGEVTRKGIEKALTLQGIYPLRIPKAEFALNSAFPRMLFNAFEGFSLLAALIGIGGLAIIMMRVIRERRQQIGMLRAIGVRPGLIYWSILTEGALIGVLGIVLGTLIGSYVGAMMIEMFAAGEQVTMQFPTGKLGLYVGCTLFIAMLGTMLPARRAFQLPPAEATKYLG